MYTVTIFSKFDNVPTQKISEFKTYNEATGFCVDQINREAIKDDILSETQEVYEIERVYTIVDHTSRPERIVREVKLNFKG